MPAMKMNNIKTLVIFLMAFLSGLLLFFSTAKEAQSSEILVIKGMLTTETCLIKGKNYNQKDAGRLVDRPKNTQGRTRYF